jgi:putative PD-(D/E)XK family protein DUF4420
MKITKMTNNNTSQFFNDNPWSHISDPCYPNGRRLYLGDDRFWVSMDDDRYILFFVQDTGADKIKPLENLAGLNVTIEKYEAGQYRLVCRLTSFEPEIMDKFVTVAKDIAFHCSEYKSAQLFIKIQERIKSWANFLKPSRVGLKHSEFVGLLGELYVLSEYFMTQLTALDSIRAWIGPEDKKQDFAFNNIAIEVKTSLAGDQQVIKISSLDQLDKVTDELYLLRVVAVPSGDDTGYSLKKLYEECLGKIDKDDEAESLFLHRVSKLYGKASESQLKSHYVISNVSLFNVKDGFPRITRDDVVAAINNVKYDINVSAISKFEINKDITEIIKHG